MEHLNLKLFLALPSAAEPNFAPRFQTILGFYLNTNPFLYQPNPQNGFPGAQRWFLQPGRNNGDISKRRQLQVTPGAAPQLFLGLEPGGKGLTCAVSRMAFSNSL